MRFVNTLYLLSVLPSSCSFAFISWIHGISESSFPCLSAQTSLQLKSSSGAGEASQTSSRSFSDNNQNKVYIEGLIQNLSTALDRWIVTGSMGTRKRAFNILQQISRDSMDEELIKQSRRMVTRAGMSLDDPNKPGTESSQRKEDAEQRKQWEKERDVNPSTEKKKFVGNIAGSKATGRSVLSTRSSRNGEPDPILPASGRSLDAIEFAESKKRLEDDLEAKMNPSVKSSIKETDNNHNSDLNIAEVLSSEIIAKSGAGSAFDGKRLGIGGLDNELAQIKRRIWVPLAAPPSLLKDLGIMPVKGLLLYGLPGCGKTLLARSLGKMLSPMRPITVISGPEIMDKFVGSSEANLRQLFDDPPDIYDNFRIGLKDNGQALSKSALHLIILDEFDAMARARGGRGSTGDQGDAGVARDSVVNQLLSKMDGVGPLDVPTLVIGLTNRRSLIEPALLRPGRFEVQIEIPKPRTVAQRVSILDVHMNKMFKSGRLLIRDAPPRTAASKRIGITSNNSDEIPTYFELLDIMAIKCDGMSGASLAGVVRAAASRALERAVYEFTDNFSVESTESEKCSISDCLVTQDDITKAIGDVLESSKGGDGGEDESKMEELVDTNNSTSQ